MKWPLCQLTEVRRYRPKAERVLPDGLRAVVWAMPGETLETPGFPPRPTPLDKHGHALRQISYGISRSIRGRGLLFEVPSNKVSNPANPPAGPCAIKTTRAAGLAVQGASVVSAVKSYGGLIGNAFLACANTEYIFAGWPMSASILIDAVRPGTIPPSLPLMKAVQDVPRSSKSQGNLAHRWLAAYRVGGWLYGVARLRFSA